MIELKVKPVPEQPYHAYDGWNIVLVVWGYQRRFDVTIYFQFPIEDRFQAACRAFGIA